MNATRRKLGPFLCIRCGKPFGVKSTIERITAKLKGAHWMYQSAKRLDVIKICRAKAGRLSRAHS
jgi:hypothetical protein